MAGTLLQFSKPFCSSLSHVGRSRKTLDCVNHASRGSTVVCPKKLVQVLIVGGSVDLELGKGSALK
jgi:hypothetical protein